MQCMCNFHRLKKLCSCFLFFVLFLIACELADAVCTYPVQWTTNAYYDNEKGPVTFSGNTMEGWQVTLTTIQKTISSWECYQRNGSIIVSKNKEKMMMYGITFYAFVCMVVDFKESYFFYKLWSAEEARADGERIKIKTQSQASLCEICDKHFIPDTSEIKYMCTLETCDNVDTSQYIDPATVCSGQDPTTTRTTEKTTTDQLSLKTEETTTTTTITTKMTTIKTLTNQSSSRAIETSTTTTDTTAQQPSSGSTATPATTTATSTQQLPSGSTATTAITTATSTQQPSSGSTATTAITTATSTQQPSSGSTVTTAITTATSTQQPSSGSVSTSTSMTTSNQQPEDLSTTLPYTSTTSSLVHISSVGSSTHILLPDKTSLNTSPSSSSKPEQVQTTTKDLFKTLSTKTDGVMTSLSTTNATNPAKLSTTNGVTTNEITTSSRSNDKQITDTSASTPSFSSIVSTTNIPEKKSSVPFLSAKSRPDSDILSMFTSEALVICAVLSILILSVTLVSISIALKRKKSSTRRHRRLTHPSHIKPMYYGRHDFYYHP